MVEELILKVPREELFERKIRLIDIILYLIFHVIIPFHMHVSPVSILCRI